MLGLPPGFHCCPTLPSFPWELQSHSRQGAGGDASLVGRGARGSGVGLVSWSWELKCSPTQKLPLMKSFALDVTFNLVLKARQALETVPDTI